MEKISVIKEVIIRSVKKCGFSVAFDRSKNDQVSTDGIPNYDMPQRFVEEELKLLDNKEDEDEDAN